MQALQSEFPQVQVMAAKAVWGLGTTIHGRAKLVEAGVMEQLLDVLYASFSTNIRGWRSLGLLERVFGGGAGQRGIPGAAVGPTCPPTAASPRIGTQIAPGRAIAQRR